MRICILSNNNIPLGFIDNDAPKGLNMYDDTLHVYMEGAAHTLEFTTSANHEDAAMLEVGTRLSFYHGDKPYYMIIMKTSQSEDEKEVLAYSWSFELLNEVAPAYAATAAMSFEEYIQAFGFEYDSLEIGVNEVSDKQIKHEWTGSSDTVLARLFSLANVFGAEIEFMPVLNDDYTLKSITLNIYRAHDAEHQGVGEYRNDVILRYGIDIQGITREQDITSLATAIYPTGKTEDSAGGEVQVIDLSNYEKTEYDENGQIEFYTSKTENPKWIMAVQARDRFPSTVDEDSDRYILYRWDTDYSTVESLYGNALAKLKELCVPATEYTIKGYTDLNIGDTVRVSDEAFNPPLYLEVRVTEQQISFTDSSKNKSTFSNVVELQKEISDELISRMQDLMNANKTYAGSVLSNNGVVFKNSDGNTTLQMKVFDGRTDVTSNLSYRWYKDGIKVSENPTITVYGSQIDEKAVYKVEAVDASGVVRAISEATVSNVNDGGEPSQYFWHDNNGAHVSTVANSTAGNNLLLTSDGVFIRNGDAILASFEDDEINIGVYDYTSAINFGGILSLIAEGQGEVSIKSSAIRTDYPLSIESMEASISLSGTDLHMGCKHPYGGTSYICSISMSYVTGRININGDVYINGQPLSA